VLRCFQHLSVRNVATLRCHCSDNRHTRGFLMQVLSYYAQLPSRIQTPILDRVRTDLHRSEPSSRNLLTGEQPDPWDLLQPQDRMSRHRCHIKSTVTCSLDYTFIPRSSLSEVGASLLSKFFPRISGTLNPHKIVKVVTGPAKPDSLGVVLPLLVRSSPILASIFFKKTNLIGITG
jgi:hypothetical protein